MEFIFKTYKEAQTKAVILWNTVYILFSEELN
jgi:hypothetical protein